MNSTLAAATGGRQTHRPHKEILAINDHEIFITVSLNDD